MSVDDLLSKKIKIGVTGLSRAGKTVFIGAITQALLTADAWASRRGQGPLADFSVFEKGFFRFAQIRDDIKPDIPQFPFRKVRDALTGKQARWPVPTEGISSLILDLDYKTTSRFLSHRKVQLEFVDYPGEWLIDFPMLNQTYAEWSALMLEYADKNPRIAWAGAFFAILKTVSPTTRFDEDIVDRLADAWSDYLHQAAENGHTFNQPGRLLRPDNLRHSPVLRLVPLPPELLKSDFGKKLSRRFEEYKSKVIRPFYKQHFSRMDRQILLMDVLRSIRLGEAVFNEYVDALSETLKTFRYGRGGFWSWLGRTETTHVLIAPTKADHVIRADRANLETMVRKLMRLVDVNNELAKALKYDVIPLASIRATQDRRTSAPPVRELLYGRPEGLDTGAYDPGLLPLEFPLDWSAEIPFEFYNFLPMPELMPEPLYQGFPSINTGKVLNFLLGDLFE